MEPVYFYSAESNSFFPLSMKEDYERTNTWPEKAVEVDEETFIEFSGPYPEGKQRGSNKKGYPAWVDAPPPTKEEQISLAKGLKDSYRLEADKVIAPLQDAVDLDMATEKEASDLLAWKKYRVLLNRIDTSSAPDIEWPEVPTT